MWLDALVFGVLAAFAWMGARRGAAAAAMGLVVLIGSYAAAIAFGGAYGPAVAIGLALPEWAGIPVAGTAAFAVAFVLLSLLGWVVKRAAEVPAGESRSPRDRFLGAVFGALRGALVALLLSYGVIWLDALRATGTAEVVPPIGSSTAAEVTEAVVVAGVESALSESGPAARVVARVAGRPGASLAELQRVISSPHLDALQHDRLFWTHVEAGSVDAALNQGSFLQLSNDAAMRQQLAALGFVDEADAESPSAFRAAAREVLVEIGPRLRGLRHDPELRELLADPQVVAMVQAGDTIGLMRHDRFRRLVAHIAAPD